jgi:hypothetical protein
MVGNMYRFTKNIIKKYYAATISFDVTVPPDLTPTQRYVSPRTQFPTIQYPLIPVGPYDPPPPPEPRLVHVIETPGTPFPVTEDITYPNILTFGSVVGGGVVFPVSNVVCGTVVLLVVVSWVVGVPVSSGVGGRVYVTFDVIGGLVVSSVVMIVIISVTGIL